MVDKWALVMESFADACDLQTGKRLPLQFGLLAFLWVCLGVLFKGQRWRVYASPAQPTFGERAGLVFILYRRGF